MKIRLNELFDKFDENEMDMIPQKSINTNVDSSMVESIKDNVLSSIGAKKKTTRHFGKIIALVAVISILVSSLSVGATVYYKPDGDLAQLIDFNDTVDVNSMGRKLDISSTSQGLTYTLKQVLTDNNILYAEFESPRYNGERFVPSIINISINGRDSWGGCKTHFEEDKNSNTMIVTFYDLKNIRTGSKIKINFTDPDVWHNDDLESMGEGYEWNFEFDSFRSNVQQKLEVDDLKIGENEIYHFKNFVISPLGFRFDYIFEGDKESNDLTLFKASYIAYVENKPCIIVEMKDGTLYMDTEKEFGNCDIELDASSQRHLNGPITGHGSAVFYSIINVDEIKSITLFDQVIYKN